MKLHPVPMWSLLPLLIGTGVFLGLALPLSKYAAQQGVGALDFALWPTVLAALLLSMRAVHRHGRPAQPARLLRFGLIAGLLGHALPMSLAFYLSAQAGAGFAALAFTLPPVFTLGLSLLLRLEPWRWQRVLAVVLGLAGALLLVGSRLGDAGPADAAVLLLLLAVPALIGAGNVYRSRRLPQGQANEWLGAATLAGSVLLLAPLRLLLDLPLPPAEAGAWLALAGQAAAMALGYLLYFRLQRVAEPVSFSFMGYVITVTGLVLGALLFDEALSWRLLPGLLLIVAGFRLIRLPLPAGARACHAQVILGH
ncbi:EamA family transporter [Roseateles toxinivorans]|uniref:EamA-like transporter family protein n=1 Tax=Roseateles toxinivorans TaxID=270368 RepID=A0A4R6QN64_9BURK|nr:EamA family transporter [Roseateles toxinivorans]TDP72416.1 EamA-like transporter family protein [Roseateles toxinivorans]